MGGGSELQPKVNTNLYLQVASSDEEESKIEYKSRIADALDDRLLIEVPINEKTGRFKRLYLGDELSAYYLTEGGVKNYFSTHVLGFKEDVIRLVAIEKPDPESITKVQRRSFLRVAAELELAVKLSEHVRFLAAQGQEPQKTWVAEGSVEKEKRADIAWIEENRSLFSD